MADTDPAALLIPQAEIAPSPLESVPAGEAAALAAITGMIEARVRAGAAASGTAIRDAHPKAHGCVEARFEVLAGLPPDLAQGLFAAPARYPAWIRFSNGNGAPQADAIGDGRGVAIKIMGAQASRSGTQDFIMINSPRFFVRDAADYVAFQAAADKNPLRFFFPGLNPFAFRLHELMAATAITRQKIANPLNIQYWSMTPYLYGENACKFSLRPTGPAFSYQSRSGPDFLHDNMAASLAQADALFDFCVQLRRSPAMPIEDPTIEWKETVSPFIPVARVVIPRQGFDAAERLAFAEALSFTPWHGLDAHRPLGGINRVRRAVYETISALRHRINGTARIEPDASPPPTAPSAQPPTKETAVSTSLLDGLGGLIGGAIDHCGWADSAASAILINQMVGSARNRPHPWSTASDYTSWKSLTDRTYQGRWLPAAAPGVQPTVEAVTALFQRPEGGQRLSAKSTCLFPAFAQYLTDGFILTLQTARDRTKSNHEIDLCQLYGRTETQTDVLREASETAGRKGRLLTQIINGEEYSPFYYLRDGETVDPRFDADHLDSVMGDHQPWVTSDMRASLFAVGGERANSTPFTVMMNTLFLREHNRVAGELEARNPPWDDERVFQTARNILIVMFIKIVVEQYINHISPAPFNLTADPSVAWRANWNRPNWITAEFSLLYRWHSLMPDVIDWPTGPIPLKAFTIDNRPLMDVGLNAAFVAAAKQPAAELGALNTSASLMPVEQFAISQARSNHLASYNDYRACFGMKRAETLADISSDPSVAAVLGELYPTVDDIEFYPGLFAEDRVVKSPLPGLLARMVAVDAFSQALTNPLLSEHVFNAATFTHWGFELIAQTRSLGEILARHTPSLDPASITMTQPTWNYGWHIP